MLVIISCELHALWLAARARRSHSAGFNNHSTTEAPGRVDTASVTGALLWSLDHYPRPVEFRASLSLSLSLSLSVMTGLEVCIGNKELTSTAVSST